MFTKATDPNHRSKPQFRNYCNYCHKSYHSISNCLRKQRENGERKHTFYSRLKSPVKSFSQNFKAYHNQIHPNEHPSSYPVNYYLRNNYAARKRSN